MNVNYGKASEIISQIGCKQIIGAEVFFMSHCSGLSYLARGRVKNVMVENLENPEGFKVPIALIIEENNRPGSVNTILSFEFIAVIGGAA